MAWLARRVRAAARGCAVLGAGVGIAACGGGASHGAAAPSPPTGTTIDIYSSLPTDGVAGIQGALVARGIRLALAQAHGRAGQFAVRYIRLDDSSPKTGRWSPLLTVENASHAIADPKTVYYIGELSSDASKLSIPIINQGGVAQVSPSSTYVGLTTNEPGSQRSEPSEYYPTGVKTFMRIVPRDSIQAPAALTAMRQEGCTNVAVADDGSSDGAGLAEQLHLHAGYGLTLTNLPSPANPQVYLEKLRARAVNCMFFAGASSPAAAQVAEVFHGALSKAKIFGGLGVCTGSYLSYLPASMRPLVYCTAPVPNLAAEPEGRQLESAYKRAYGGADPDPYFVYGYEAMKLGLDSIAALGPLGNSKAAVLGALFTSTIRQSVLGSYAFDANGDTTLRTYGLYRGAADGTLTFVTSIVSKG
jgi:branched-chain amino acid transport system substrate-binding protein